MTEPRIPDPGPRTPDPGRQTPDASGRLRGFWALFVTQFQGAFSDNVLKWLVVFMILGMNVSTAELHRVGELVTALFSLPFILFSMAGGFFADRFSKRTISVSVKIFEMGVMLLALAGFWWNQIPLLLGCVFLMGVHSSFFGPSKYGLLPELLPEKKLSWGNGLLELGTFMAIILGTVAAARMSKHFHGQPAWSGIILIALAVIGFFTCLGITRVPAADPGRKFHANFLSDLYAQLRLVRRDRPLTLAFLGNSYFFFLGQLLQLNVFFYGAEILRLDQIGIGQLSIALALGIGLGSVAAGYLSGGKIEYGLVPLGAFGMSLVSVWLSVPGLSVNAALVRLSLLGFTGGFFIVPIAALLQHRPDPAKKGEVLAAANLLSFVGIFLASGAYYLLADVAGLSPREVFLFGGVLTLAGAIYVLFLLPDALLRFLLWCATHSFYRIRIVGRDHIPAKGGALFVCNHVSWMDALLFIASTDRPVRFLMFKDIYEQAWMKPFARILGVIPISSEQRPREMLHSLQTASDAIRNGEVVCIFAEGQITRIGQLLPFRRGLERIMKDVDAPIVPVALDGVLGSPSSFQHGRFVWKLPARLPHPVTVSFGRPLPANATAFALRQAVQELLADAWPYRRDRMQPLPRAFVRTARRHPRRFAMADANNAKVTFGAVLVKTVFLARRLKKIGGARLLTSRRCSAMARRRPDSQGRLPRRSRMCRRGQNGWHFPAPLRARRAGQLRRVAPRQSAGQFELHRVRINPGIVHQTMRHQNCCHFADVSGEGEAGVAVRNHFSGRPRRRGELCESPISGRRSAPPSEFIGKNHSLADGEISPRRFARTDPVFKSKIENRKSKIPGLSRHRDFFQWQHRRAKRRHAVAL